MSFEELDEMAFFEEINKMLEDELEEESKKERKLNKVQIVVNEQLVDEVMLDGNSLEMLFETIDNCLMYQQVI